MQLECYHPCLTPIHYSLFSMHADRHWSSVVYCRFGPQNGFFCSVIGIILWWLALEVGMRPFFALSLFVLVKQAIFSALSTLLLILPAYPPPPLPKYMSKVNGLIKLLTPPPLLLQPYQTMFFGHSVYDHNTPFLSLPSDSANS